MPDFERWEQKAMGRLKRYENTDYEYFTNMLYETGRAAANGIVQGIMNRGRSLLNIFSSPLEVQNINGKNFSENYGIQSKVGRKIGVAVGNAAVNKGSELVNNLLTRNFFYPSGKSVADTAFAGRVTFDREMARQMFNDCGYVPDFPAMLKQMYDTAVGVNVGLTDVTWRRDITPHMLRTAYLAELENTFDAIRKQHRENTGFSSRTLLKTHMEKAARHLGSIFEKFSLDLANNTDYLEAPMTILPQPVNTHRNKGLTEGEQKLLANVSRHSLFPGQSAMDKHISQAMKKLPTPSVQELLDRFTGNLNKPMRDKDGREVPFRKNVDRAEDTRRLDNSILSLREMKRRYESRNFFSRFLTSTGRAERAAIARMEAQISEKLGVRGRELDGLVNLSRPLEAREVDLTQIMGIAKRDPEPEPEAPTFTDTVRGALHKTGEVLSNVAEATHTMTGAVVTNLSNTLSDAADSFQQNMQDPSKDFFDGKGLADDLKEEDIHADLFSPAFTDSQPKNEVKKDPKPEPPQEPQSDGIFSNMVQAAGMVMHIMNPMNLFSNFFGKKEEPQTIHLFKDDPDYQKQNPEPVKTEPEARPAPKKTESAPARNSPHQELLLGKQTEVYNALRTSNKMAEEFLPALSRLLYFKTLEVSLSSKSMKPEQLESSLSEQSIKNNCAHIRASAAFQRLDLLTRGLGAKSKAFVEKAPTDPSILNRIHKEYMFRLHNPELNVAKVPVPEAELSKDISREAISKAMNELRM